ncbi:MAG TPA: HD domain-containing protein [Casimicrobiaceae bacterium]|nr:HD domain-containing protein [Casimicrobiaceae bacterium]
MSMTIPGIRELFDAKGDRMYSGEPVTQLEHALQTAALAEGAGADASLVAASLLHDLGHLLNDQGETPTARGIDDVHQYIAIPFLRPLFGDEVLDPIRLHVDAKRYLCATRPAYYESLSEDSRRSLALQGGVYSPAEAARFASRPGADRAVALRLWDDAAKVAGGATPPFGHFLALLASVARNAAR